MDVLNFIKTMCTIEEKYISSDKLCDVVMIAMTWFFFFFIHTLHVRVTSWHKYNDYTGTMNTSNERHNEDDVILFHGHRVIKKTRCQG